MGVNGVMPSRKLERRFVEYNDPLTHRLIRFHHRFRRLMPDFALPAYSG